MSTRDAHKPVLSEKTQAMALKKRQKMLGEKKDNVTIVELLLHNNDKNDYLEKQRQEKEQKTLEECTFKPKTLTYHSGAQ
jgi:hypothetical protein